LESEFPRKYSSLMGKIALQSSPMTSATTFTLHHE
jgi:hypothetical protein